jgi:hypothetical protein
MDFSDIAGEPCQGCGREPGECMCPDDLMDFDPLGELERYDPDWDDYTEDLDHDDKDDDAVPDALG